MGTCERRKNDLSSGSQSHTLQLHEGGKTLHDRTFATPTAFSSNFSGFFVCHPIYNDQILYRTLRHLFCHCKQHWNSHLHVPSMLGRKNEHQLILKTPRRLPPLVLHSRCYIIIWPQLATHFRLTKILLPCHSWNMHIVAVWNTAARLCLKSRNPTRRSGTWLVTFQKLIGSTKVTVMTQSTGFEKTFSWLPTHTLLTTINGHFSLHNPAHT